MRAFGARGWERELIAKIHVQPIGKLAMFCVRTGFGGAATESDAVQRRRRQKVCWLAGWEAGWCTQCVGFSVNEQMMCILHSLRDQLSVIEDVNRRETRLWRDKSVSGRIFVFHVLNKNNNKKRNVWMNISSDQSRWKYAKSQNVRTHEEEEETNV